MKLSKKQTTNASASNALSPQETVRKAFPKAKAYGSLKTDAPKVRIKGSTLTASLELTEMGCYLKSGKGVNFGSSTAYLQDEDGNTIRVALTVTGYPPKTTR